MTGREGCKNAENQAIECGIFPLNLKTSQH
jgi:hypothetical protein